MSHYWTTRINFNYYKRVNYLLDNLINNEYKDSHPSIIDIGSRDTEVIFNYRGDKTLLDIKNCYNKAQTNKIQELGINFIQDSIYTYTPNRTYDIALCLQTLEHLDDPALAFQKVLGMSKYSIISLPYKWEPDYEDGSNHSQHLVDENIIQQWSNKEPIESYKESESSKPDLVRIINLYKNF